MDVSHVLLALGKGMHLYLGHAAGVWCYLERKGSPNPDQCLPGE